MRRRHVVSMLGGAVVLAAIAAGTAPSGSAAAPDASAKAAAGPGKWVQLSGGSGISPIDDPAVHRFGSSLQVVWTQGGATDTLHTRILNAGGAPASGDQTLLSWAAVNAYPAITSGPGGRLIAFSGLQDTNTANPFSQGYGYYLTSTDGMTWTLADSTLGSDHSAYGSYGTGVTNAAGTPVVVYTDATAADISYRAGFDTLPPATATDATTQASSCCAYSAGVGYDTKSHQTWTAWYSNSAKAGSDGINAQRIYPTASGRVQAPSSTTKFNGLFQSIAPDQRVQVAARAGGGLYTAYGIGYPMQTKVALWKVGGGKAKTVSSRKEIAFPGVAAAPSGRLWLFWWDRNTATMHATRTNKSGSRLGAICAVHTPHNTTSVWDTAGDGGNGKLDLVVNASVGSSEQFYSTQVLPCLSASVSPGTVKSSRGGKITVTVTDAGDPVKGAAVRYNGKTKHTNARGKVDFGIAKHAAKHSYAVTYGDSGYTGGTLHFRVN